MTEWQGPCELSVDIEQSAGQPLIVKCGKPGEWYKGGPFGLVLCPEHVHHKERIMAKWNEASKALAMARLARRNARQHHE